MVTRSRLPLALFRHGPARNAAVGCAVWAVVFLRSQANAQTLQERPATARATVAAAFGPPPGVDVREAVRDALSNDSHLVSSGVEVAVNDGIVELGGTVAAPLWRQRAARVAGVVQGVRAVVNRVRVVPVARPNHLVARDVERALRRTRALGRMPISARVVDGVVELSGAISSWDEQQLAERVATGVIGVRFCQNQLSWARAIERTPAVIAADVESRLNWDPLVQHDPIHVQVRGARVVLRGTTGGPAERARAIALGWVEGVRSVDADALIIDNVNRPDQNVRVAFPTDAEIALAIRDLTPRWWAIPPPGWSSVVSAGVVTLSGTTPTLAEAHAIEAMTRSVVGVVDVRRELRGPWWNPPAAQARPKRSSRRR